MNRGLAKRVWGIVALIASAVAIRHDGVHAVGVASASQELNGSSVVQALEPCSAAAPSAPDTWKRIDNSFLTIAMPQCFALDDSEPPGVHRGGQRWLCGKTTVEVLWGMWGATSFQTPGETCRDTVRGIPVMRKYSEANGYPQALTWYLTDSPHQPIVAAYSDEPDGRALVQQIANSGTVKTR